MNKKDLEDTIKEIQAVYLSDSRPLYIGFSGGKDSTVTLSLVTRAIRELPEAERQASIYVLFSDTLMEMPPVIGQIHNSIQAFIAYTKEEGLPFIFQKVEPELKNRFFNQIIGKGATLPRTDLRWCTQKMKITPMENAVQAVVDRFGGYVAITGARKDESPDRAARLERNAVTPGSRIKVHADSRCNLFCPIEDWTSEDVWNYIYTDAEPWVNANALGIVYSEAAGDGDECTTVLEGGDAGQKPGCSKSARYGCWVCPLFDRDKTLGNLSRGHDYLVYMEEFRNWLVQFRDGKWDEVRDVYNHKEGFQRLQYSYDNERFGITSPGGYSLPFRIEMLERLLATEADVREKMDIRLIEDEDLEFIQHCWILEGDIAFTCKKLAEKYGRTVHISDNDRLISKYAAVLFLTKDAWNTRLVYRFGIYANERFCVQYVKEVLNGPDDEPVSLFPEIDTEKKIIDIIDKLSDAKDAALFFADTLSSMKVRTQFYPKPDLEKLIRREWKEDKASFVTQVFLADNGDGEIEEHEEGYDWLEDEDISLEDKMSMLDNWNHYTPEARVPEKPKGKKWKAVVDEYNDFKYKPRTLTKKQKELAVAEAAALEQQVNQAEA